MSLLQKRVERKEESGEEMGVGASEEGSGEEEGEKEVGVPPWRVHREQRPTAFEAEVFCAQVKESQRIVGG